MMSTVNLISQGKFKRLISKLDKSSATKLPQGNLVLQSGQGKHSHEGILTEVYRTHHIYSGFCTFWPLIQSILDIYTAHIQQDVAPLISVAAPLMLSNW